MMTFNGRKRMTTQMKIFTAVCLFLFTAVFTACASDSMGGAYYATPMPGTGGAAVAQGQPTDGGQARLDAQATLQAIAYVEQQQTAVAQAATAQAVATVQAQQTAVAYATQAAQATTEAVATGTAVAVVATEEARAADMHALEMEATRVAITQQQIAVAQQATLDASLIADQQERMIMQRESEAARLEYERVWNYWLKPILIVLLVMVLFGAAMFALHSAWLYVNYRLNPVHVVTEQPGTQLFVNPNFTPFKQLTSPLPALPAPKADSEPTQVQDSVQSSKLPQPRWEAMIMFMKQGDGSLVPLGVDRRNRPIIIDWSHDPHLSIAGSTRRGKTATGMVTYIAGLLTGGVHVILVNGKGADFKHIEGHRNLTVVPRPRDDYAQVTAVTRIVSALNEEMNARDRVLYETGATNWNKVPTHKRHAGVVCIAIDEFLSILDAAADMAADPRIRRDDRETADELAGQVMDMWRVLKKLTSEGAKYGLLFVASFTDPSSKNLGAYGMRVLSQMTRVAFGMNNGNLSNSYLSLESGSDFPRGSAGLPPGEFLINLNGAVRHGRGFYPKEDDIQSLYTAVPVPPARLPDTVQAAIGRSSNNGADWGDTRQVESIPADTWPTTPRTAVVTAAERDSNLLDILAKEGDVVSLNKIACFLSGNDSGKASGEEYERAAEALLWRITHRQCAWGMAVVETYDTKYLDKAKAHVALMR